MSLISRFPKLIQKTVIYGLLSTSLLLGIPALAATTDLQSGPMVGYSEMKEVLLWAQTNKTAKVRFLYWEKNKPEIVYETREVLTKKENGFVAKLIADQLQPGKKYQYDLYINAEKVERPYPLEFQSQQLWQHRTDPPEFNVAIGSCTFVNEKELDRPGRGYGGEYEIFESIYQKHPDVMLWLGDNTYLREADWNTRTGIMYRYTHTRSLPEIQPLLASVHNYAIWDDHDFGPNDSDRSYREKDKTLEMFSLFWGNQSYGLRDLPGTFSRFEWGDVEFFLLDNRYYRTPINRRTSKRTILGEQQIEWLIDALASSNAPFKVVAMGGQFLNPLAKYENYAVFAEERDKLLTLIKAENIKGVLFLTGDRHHTVLSKLEREGTYPLYDFTISPLTSGPYGAPNEANTLRVPGTHVGERNYAIMNFAGSRKDRHLTVTVYDKKGKQLWQKFIRASELQ